MLPGASLARMVAQMGFDVSLVLYISPHQEVLAYVLTVRDN